MTTGQRQDLRDVARDDERRKRDEAKLVTIQQQLDELRTILREFTARQGRNEEQFRSYEVALAGQRQAVEQQRHEATQAAQARQLEDARVRQQIVDLDARIEETGRPIRSLQAHVTELVDTIRRGRDDSQDELRRHEELKGIIEHIAAITERNSGVAASLRESIAALRTDLEQTQRDLIKAEDAVKIVEQELRRRMTESGQETRNINAKIEEMRPNFTQLDARIDEVRASIVHIDPALQELAEIDVRVQEETARLYSQTVERDDLLSERIDEIRRHLDTQVRDLRQIGEQRFDRINARVDGLSDIDRELAYRLNIIDMRLDELRDIDVKLRRELWHLHELQTRRRLDQSQADVEAVIEARRVAEQEMAAERPDRTDRTQRGERSGGAG
jgi:chromosome segregation ATPase